MVWRALLTMSVWRAPTVECVSRRSMRNIAEAFKTRSSVSRFSFETFFAHVSPSTMLQGSARA
ncbi:hypothetical protein D7S86_26120 [Pararobbsia silviterrae]|uniref:Uncharacterized protein n=1 Tax=Pararobbsia silviterrae TaxID=1792498 RepID=A0A494X3Q5_9BURK|nr:hypothetical protein D7S86_26120 [Pararobbsia silviterrae]